MEPNADLEVWRWNSAIQSPMGAVGFRGYTRAEGAISMGADGAGGNPQPGHLPTTSFSIILRPCERKQRFP